jgi:predicted enzyme related to lactoylglutathione lyase
MQPSPYGRFVWHELMTHDPDAAIAFYTKVVGWTITPWADDPSYRQWTAPRGRTVGGVMRLPPEAEQLGAPPQWLFYLGVADADDTVGAALERRGKVVNGPVEMTGIGKFAVLNDPQGAVFAILQAPAQARRRQAPPTPGDFSWHELMTRDREAAWDFYHALFGWEKTGSMDMGNGRRYQMFGWNGISVGGMFTQTPDMPSPPNWVCYAMVPNADAAARRVQASGGQVLKGPMDVPGGDRIAICLDPHGAAFAVHSTAQVVRARPVPKPRGRPVKKAAPARTRKKAAKRGRAGRRR